MALLQPAPGAGAPGNRGAFPGVSWQRAGALDRLGEEVQRPWPPASWPRPPSSRPLEGWGLGDGPPWLPAVIRGAARSVSSSCPWHLEPIVPGWPDVTGLRALRRSGACRNGRGLWPAHLRWKRRADGRLGPWQLLSPARHHVVTTSSPRHHVHLHGRGSPSGERGLTCHRLSDGPSRHQVRESRPPAVGGPQAWPSPGRGTGPRRDTGLSARGRCPSDWLTIRAEAKAKATAARLLWPSARSPDPRAPQRRAAP